MFIYVRAPNCYKLREVNSMITMSKRARIVKRSLFLKEAFTFHGEDMMNRQLTFAEYLESHREDRNEFRPVVRPKPINLPTNLEERSRVIREAAKRVIERHRDELESLAYK